MAEAWGQASQHHRPKVVAEQLAAALDRIPAVDIAATALAAAWRKRYKPSTTHQLVTQLRRLLAVIDDHCGTKARAKVPATPRGKPRQQTLQPEQLDAAIRAASPPLRMFLMLTGIMALRSGEAMAAGWQHYDEPERLLRITTKGKHERQFAVPEEIHKLIATCPPDSATFIGGLRGQKTTRRVIYKAWERLKEKIGIPRDVIPHDLRRTAAVRIYRQTKNVLAAQKLLGHDSLDSTARYLQPYEPEAMRIIRNELTRWTPAKGEPKQ